MSVATEGSAAAAGPSLRALCHDLVEPTATIRLLVRVAHAEQRQDLRDKLGAIDAAAGQIAAICEHIVDWAQPREGLLLDRLASETVASAQVLYAGAIEVVSQPVMALARPGDVIRILFRILADACRADGVRALVDEAAGQARLTIANSGGGLGDAIPAGRASLVLEIISTLTLKYGGSVHFGGSDLGGLAVTVRLPQPGRSSN